MTKDEAREDAWNKRLGEYNAVHRHRGMPSAYADGFDDGYEYANKWHVIERDGLPPFDGDYLCTVRLPQECGNVWIRQQVLPCVNNSFGADVIAWREIEPYKGE